MRQLAAKAALLASTVADCAATIILLVTSCISLVLVMDCAVFSATGGITLMPCLTHCSKPSQDWSTFADLPMGRQQMSTSSLPASIWGNRAW
jgi:hypothetical protein